MAIKRTRPALREVRIEDPFWTPWLDTVRTVMLPYVLDKMEEVGYAENYRDLAAKNGAKHKGPPFSDGLLLESLRGACDFLALHPDTALEKRFDGISPGTYRKCSRYAKNGETLTDDVYEPLEENIEGENLSEIEKE